MNNEAEAAPIRHQIAAAQHFIESLATTGRVAFSLKELVEKTGLSAIAANRQLSRLSHSVTRVSSRQPFFLVVAPEHRAMGAPPAIWWLDEYFNWLGYPYYLALQSAASVHGSSPQALQVTQVMTDRPLRPINVGRVQVLFFVKRDISRTPTMQLERAVAPLTVSTPEATVFDLVRYATRIGGIGRAAETIVPLLPKLRSSELGRALEAENKPPVAQRLGFILEAEGAKKLAGTVHQWLPEKLPAVPLLPLAGERKNIRLVKRWRVFDNSGDLRL